MPKRKHTALTTRDHFHLGVLMALGVIYDHDAETVAEEIVTACGKDDLLRLAKLEHDPCLPHLRKTVKFLTSRIITTRKEISHA